MVSVTLYVEGGGDSAALKRACRKGFRKFIEKAGLIGSMPKIVACGSRGNAYQSFCIAHASEKGPAMLLVDAEEPVTASGPWQHLKDRDRWDRPDTATDDQCHLMVQAMESWFLADKDALQSFYRQGFRSQDLPQDLAIENIPKLEVFNGLSRATRNTKRYKKGTDSFEILEKLDPQKVRNASDYADRFICALRSAAGIGCDRAETW